MEIESAVIAAIVAALAAVFTAIVAAAASITATIINIHQSKTVEFNKHKQAILEYRCDKLFSLLERIIAEVGFVTHKESYQDGTLTKEEIRKKGEIVQGKTIKEIYQEQYQILIGIWLLAEPLIDSEEAKTNIEKIYREEKKASAEKEQELWEEYHKLVVEAIQTQLSALLVEQRKS